MSTAGRTPFRSYRNRYAQNLEGSMRTTARPGIFETPSGQEKPAIVIFRDMHVIAILTEDDATRLSNELIDAIENPAVRTNS